MNKIILILIVLFIFSGCHKTINKETVLIPDVDKLEKKTKPPQKAKWELAFKKLNDDESEKKSQSQKEYGWLAPYNGTNENDESLSQALQAMYAGEYGIAIEKCNKVLNKDPENILAYKRLGSAYWAAGNIPEAKKAWEKALELDPNDEVLRNFVQRYTEKQNNK